MSDQSGSVPVPAASPPARNPTAFWALALSVASFLVGYVVARFALPAVVIIRGEGQLLPVQPEHQYALATSIALALMAILLALPSLSRGRAHRTYGLLGLALSIVMLAWNVLQIIEWRMKG
ncbi:MAG: hypothetical protein ABFD92_12870 [Planctomycetaceae bacterium]|nr:hypothetical protein [Planctomycetaceae bacterium]